MQSCLSHMNLEIVSVLNKNAERIIRSKSLKNEQTNISGSKVQCASAVFTAANKIIARNFDLIHFNLTSSAMWAIAVRK